MRLRTWLLTICLSAATSCESTSQSLNIKTNVPGAEVQVLVNGAEKQKCASPCTLTLDKADRTVLRFSKEGYHPNSIVLASIAKPPPFFSHWVFFIPPVLVFRVFQYMGNGIRGGYNELTGVPETVELLPAADDSAVLLRD